MSAPENERRVLVTGAGSGIGLAVAARLAREGLIVDTVTRGPPPVEPAGHGRRFLCDLGAPDDVERLCEELAGDGHGYFGLVHCAGAAHDSLIAHVNLAAARQMMDVNFWSFVRLTKQLSTHMLRSRTGRIVAIGSIAADRGARGNGVYSATKAALNGFVRTAAQELGARSVTINVVAPGYVDTRMLERFETRLPELSKRVALGRLGAPDEVAGAVAFLMGPDASYLNGTVLTADGGLSASL